MWGQIYTHVILLIFANIFKASCERTSSLTFVKDCTSSMTDGFDGRTKIAKLLVTPQKPPKKLLNRKKRCTADLSREVEYNSDVTLSWEADGPPRPKITWSNSHGTTMYSRETVLQRPGVRYTSYISNMTVSNVLKNDRYTCYVVRSYGTCAISYDVIVKDPLVVYSAPAGTTKVVYGSEGTIPCGIRSRESMHILWYYANEITSENRQIVASDQYWISQDGTQLKIKKMDLDLVGKYTCKVSLINNKDAQKELSTSVKIDGLVTPKITGATDIKAIKGKAAVLECRIINGFPKPKIAWQFMDKTGSKFTPVSGSENVLRLSGVEEKHAGRYKCVAENVAGRDEHVTTLIIQETPKVSGIAIKKVRMGTSGIMECTVVKGEPKPKITWQFMDNSCSKFMPIGGPDNVLRISSVEIKHAGRYKCVAQNSLGSDEHVTTLIVQDPPKITSKRSTAYEIIEGDALLKIPCASTGLPKPVITWKLNGGAITPNAKYSVEDGALIIRDPKVSDTNAYTCEAKNEVGSVSATFQTHILQTPKVSGLDVKKVRMGTSAIIECMVVKGEPKPKITWQFMDKSSSKFAPVASSDNALRISNAKNKHAGRYKCVAQNNVGSDEHITTLTVESIPRITSDSSKVFEGLEGDMAIRIPCDVIGIPKPVVTWKSKSAAITSNAKYSIEDGALVIMNPNGKDSTSYTCEAKNYIGSVSATFQVNVEKFLNDLGVKHYVYLLEGETRNLECEAYSSKSQSVRWFIEGEEKKVYKLNMQVVKASVTDDGNYTCRVSDKHGYTRTHTYVVDVGHPPKLYEQIPVNDWRGDVNDIVSNCESDAKPPANVEWKFNGKVLTDQNMADLGILYKWGHYECNIRNVHGSVQRSFDVKSSACLINKNLRDAQYMPLLLTDKLTWAKWETTKHYSVVEQEEKITLSCPNLKEAPNAFQKFPKQSELKAFCNKQDMFLVDGKLYKLSDLHCSNSIQPSIIKKKVKCLTDTSELIRVGYNVAGFLETYEVCFDHAKNMPLYTRVLMTPTDGSPSTAHNWYKYPGVGYGKRDTGYTCETSLSSCCYSKSQLVNSRDFNYGPAKYSTFIDPLNAIPSLRPCKNTAKTTWEDIDDMVRSQLNNYNEFIAWSGTHTLQEKNGVVIPRFLWKVLRFDEDESIAIVHVNDPSPTDKDIKCENICVKDEISWFEASDKYTYCCKLSDFLEAFDFRGTDIGESVNVALGKIEKSS